MLIAPEQLWIGWSLIALAITLVVWGVTIDGDHWWKVVRFKRGLSGWVSLHRAFQYLVYESEWAQKQPSVSTSDEFDQLVSQEFREILARGQVRARGRKGTSPNGDNRVTELISGDFWVTAYTQPHGEIALQDDDRCIALIPRTKHGFHAIVIHAGDLEAAWPRFRTQGSRKPLPKLAEIVEPYRQMAAAAKAVSIANDQA
jgi:hypothetical protein